VGGRAQRRSADPFERTVQSQHLTADDVAAYVDREVADAERGRIEEHLSWCPSCLDEVAALLRTLRFGDDSPARPPRSS
jgi:anti-sigma factor RsiW